MIDELDELVLAKVEGKKIETKAEIIVENKFDRGKLGEGRNYGLGFSILKKITDSKYKALMAFTACKDYLNDFVYVEGTGNALGAAHGFKHTYTGILKDQDYFYVGLRPLNSNHTTTKHKYFDTVSNALKNNQNNIISFLNKLEKELKCKDLTTLEVYTDDILILKAPIFWTKFSFMFSMYGLLIRCFLNVTEEELKDNDIFNIIVSKKNCLIPEDGSLLLSCQKYFKNFNLEKVLDYKYIEPAQPYTIHNYGIVGRLAAIK